MQLMLEVKRHLQKTLPVRESKELTYTQIGYRALGPIGKWAVNISVLGCNLGVCAGYMIFISTNLQVVLLLAGEFSFFFNPSLGSLFTTLVMCVAVGLQLHLCENQPSYHLPEYLGDLRHHPSHPHPADFPPLLSVPGSRCLRGLHLPCGGHYSGSLFGVVGITDLIMCVCVGGVCVWATDASVLCSGRCWWNLEVRA